MKKGDIILIICAVLAAAALLFCFSFRSSNTVTVKENGKTVYEGSLSTDKTIYLKDKKMTLIIKNREVYMKNSDCKNQICVHTGKISKKGESIVCLPNKVVATVK